MSRRCTAALDILVAPWLPSAHSTASSSPRLGALRFGMRQMTGGEAEVVRRRRRVISRGNSRAVVALPHKRVSQRAQWAQVEDQLVVGHFSDASHFQLCVTP